MNSPAHEIGPTPSTAPSRRNADLAALLIRCLLGALFMYMGLNKALHPVEFLKLVHQYEMLQSAFLLNLVASALPWVEIFCGLLLVLGLVVRGTALVLVAMLIPFTVLVLLRALSIHQAGGLPLCAIRFDCGCGTGEVWICGKLAENTLLTILAAGLVFWPGQLLCLRPRLF